MKREHSGRIRMKRKKEGVSFKEIVFLTEMLLSLISTGVLILIVNLGSVKKKSQVDSLLTLLNFQALSVNCLALFLPLQFELALTVLQRHSLALLCLSITV